MSVVELKDKPEVGIHEGKADGYSSCSLLDKWYVNTVEIPKLLNILDNEYIELIDVIIELVIIIKSEVEYYNNNRKAINSCWILMQLLE